MKFAQLMGRVMIFVAIGFFGAIGVFAEDALILLKDGRSLHLSSVSFHEGPRFYEADGVPIQIGRSRATQSAAKYAQVHQKNGPSGLVEVMYISWNKIDEIEVLDARGPDEFSHPARLKIIGGPTIEVNIILNGANPYVLGDTSTGGPRERFHDILIGSHNASINIGQISTIRPIQHGAAPRNITQKESVDSLIAGLRSEKFDVRHDAALALGALGPKAVKAVPTLAEVLKNDKNMGARRSAASAIGRIYVDPVLESRKYEDFMGSFVGPTRSVQAIGPDADAVVAALFEALKNKTDYVLRGEAALALGEIRPRSEQLIPSLEVALKDPDSYVRGNAAIAAAWIGPEAASLVPMLIVGLSDQQYGVRSGSAQALGNIGAASKDAVPALNQSLSDSNGAVRRLAAGALGCIGPSAREAVPKLTEIAIKDDVPAVRSAAVVALRKIRK